MSARTKSLPTTRPSTIDAAAATTADRRRVQQSALHAGLWVAVAAAAIVGVITTVIVAVVFATSRPEHRPPRGGLGGPGGIDRGSGPQVVNVDDVVPVAIILGLLGVVALGVVAWWASQRAAQPLARALEVQRGFVADAGHELRTPLTALTSRIQLAQHRAARGGDVETVLEALRRDAGVMEAVLTDLLVSAETAGSAAADSDAVCSVANAASDAMSVIEPRAAERGVALVAEASVELNAAADHTSLVRALIALLDNAVRYSPARSTVRVRALASGRRVEIRVTDEGTGIDGIGPDRLFDRFARSTEPADAQGRRGFGLGLALVRDVATRFGGSVRLERTSPAGTTFLLDLPAREHARAR